MCGLGRRWRGRDDWRGAVSGEEIPCAARDHDECDDRNDQRQDRRARFRLGCLCRRCRLRRRRADLQRIDADRFGDVLEPGRAEVGDRKFEPPLDLAVGVLGETDRAGRGDPFQSRGDVDAVAHEVAVGLLDDVAQMNADAKVDAPLLRQAGIALDQAVLHFDRAAHRVDHAAEFDETAVAGALDHSSVMDGDGRIDQIAPQRPQPRERALLVGAGEPAIADHVSDQNRRNLPGFAHGAPSGTMRHSTKPVKAAGYMLRASEPRGGRPSQHSKAGFGGSIRSVDRRAMSALCANET